MGIGIESVGVGGVDSVDGAKRMGSEIERLGKEEN